MRLDMSRGQRAGCLIAVWLLILCSCSDDDQTIEFNFSRERAGHWVTEYTRDYEYVEGRIFNLAYPGEIDPQDRVESIRVFEEALNPSDPEAEIMYLDIGPTDPTNTYDHANILMKEIAREQYELLYGRDTAHCPVALVFYSGRRGALGIRTEIARYDISGFPTGVVDTIGYDGVGFDTLRVIQPIMPDNWPDNPAWQLMWRNCYRILINISCEDIEFRVFKGVPGTEGTPACLDYQEVDGVAQDPYTQILGLDQCNNNQTNIELPDGKLDCWAGIFRPDWGMVIFPEREPFNSNRRFADAYGNLTDALAVKVATLYNYSSQVEKAESSVYYLQIQYRID